MFTGLIEHVGQIRSAAGKGANASLAVDVGSLAEDLAQGDSVAVDGVCLTVTRLQGVHAAFDVSDETAQRSTIPRLPAGRKVNLERALKVGDRLGGHLVQGHVDGQADIKRIQRQGSFVSITFGASKALLDQMVEKGSVAVNGISLTIAALEPADFSVAVVPETLVRTTLAEARVHDRVNIETDMVVKTIRRYLDTLLADKAPLSVDKLRQLGF